MSNDKAIFTAAEGSHAAIMCITALAAEFVQKGTLTHDESNYVFALAASMCRGGNNEQAAKIIENVVPTAVGIDVVAIAKSRGANIDIKD